MTVSVFCIYADKNLIRIVPTVGNLRFAQFGERPRSSLEREAENAKESNDLKLSTSLIAGKKCPLFTVIYHRFRTAAHFIGGIVEYAACFSKIMN